MIQNIGKPHSQIESYEKIDIYQMRCIDCPLKYIEQTGLAFCTRYEECIQAVRNNNGNSGCSNHILDTGHTYWSITDTINIIKTEKKGKHLIILEKYCIHKISENRLHMNDAYIDIYNPVFETLQ